MAGSRDQVNRYTSAASGPKNKGAQPSKRQMDTAKNTAIGHSRGTITRKPATSAVRSDLRMSVSRSSSTLRPSKEGLMSAPSTLISMNGTGYDNPKLQKARYNPKRIGNTTSPSSFSTTMTPRSITTNYTGRELGHGSGKVLSRILKKRLL